MSGGAFIKSSAGEWSGHGLEWDIERCRALVRSVIEMVRIEDVTHLETGTIETILEMVEEGLVSIRDGYFSGTYDQEAPTKEPTEEAQA